MKKLFLALLLIFILASSALAAGTVTITSTTISVQAQPTRKVITLSWQCEAGAATIPNTTITAATYGIGGWYFYSAETNPGATAPTDNYDITILDADGADIAGGMLMNRDSTASEYVSIGVGATGQYPVVRGDLTFTLSNNAVNAALGTLILVFISN